MAWREDITCWTPERADRLIPVEAEALPDDLFRATHVPLRLRRVSATKPMATGGERLTELQVLQELLRRLNPESRETDIFPILGASGAGKSHLVRWLRTELPGRVEAADVRVVFIPKHRTSLRGVISSIMGAFEDVEGMQELRDRLLGARDDSITDAELRGRVRDALCNGLEYHADRTETAGPKEESARKYIASGLPAVLRDPHFAPRYLEDGGAIARLVEEKLTGRSGDDALDHAFRFDASDIDVSVDDVTRAARAAQEIASGLSSDPVVAGDVTLRAFAARMLNDQLPGAIKEVFGIGGDDLRDLFVEVRRLLHGKDDILLLVEDFAMFQGLQAGLVDAMTLASSVTEPLCHLITVVAVTTGYYDTEIPDTFKTRASSAFVVDEQEQDAPAAFAARYLRAMRLEEGSVGDANSCESCPVATECHDAFGHVDGEGIFPFNRVLLGRGVESLLDGQFNARRFLTQVLRPVLVDEHESIRALEHPSEGLAEHLDARRYEPDGGALMELRSLDEGDRRARLALLYRDPVNDGDLQEPIHAAFGLSPLNRAGRDVPCRAEGCERPAGTSGTCVDHRVGGPGEPPPVEIPRLVSAIDDWRRGRAISQNHRKDIRQLVTQAVNARIDYADGAHRASAWGGSSKLHPRFDTSGDAVSVVLDGNRKKSGGWVELALSSQEAEDAYAVQSLAWLQARGSWRSVPNGVERAGRLEKRLVEWAEDVSRQLGLGAPVDDELAAAAAALEALAGLAGSGPVPKFRADRLVRLRSDEPPQPNRWRTSVDLAEKSKTDRSLLVDLLNRRLAFAQGGGQPMAYDGRLVRLMFDRMRDVSLEQGDPGSPVGKALRSVQRRLRDVDAMGPTLLAQLPDLEDLGNEDPIELSKELDKVAKRGLVAGDARKAMRDAAKAIRESDRDAVEAARSEIGRWEELSLAERAALAGGDWVTASTRLRAFLDAVQIVLRAATPGGVPLDESERSVVESAWTNALDRVASAVDQYVEALR